MSNRSTPALMLLLLAAGNVVQAAATEQRLPERSSAPATDTASCDQLAGMPNAPMSVESCRSMLRMGEDDPSSHRPGDEALSCAQIFAELRTMQGEGVSDATAAQTDEVIRDGRALGALHAAEMARQMTPSPLAIASSLLPNAIGAALMAPEQARTVAAMAKLKTADARYSTQLGEHMATNTAELGQLMDANPRLPRLSQLAMQKNCEPPQDARPRD